MVASALADCHGTRFRASEKRKDRRQQHSPAVFFFSNAAIHGRIRFGRAGDGSFGNLWMVFRRLVPMNMDSGSSPE
jgi:hypothetical protein